MVDSRGKKGSGKVMLKLTPEKILIILTRRGGHMFQTKKRAIILQILRVCGPLKEKNKIN